MLELLDIYTYFLKREIISVHKGNFFKNITHIETPQSVNGDDSVDNAP